MKKVVLTAMALVVAVAFSAYAAEVKTTEKVKTPAGTEKITTTKTGTETTTKVVEKTKGETTKITEKTTPTTTNAKEVDKYKKGNLVTETVKFKKFEENGDYIYVIKDNKVVRLKHELPHEAKKNLLQKKEGDTITVTSTYPLTNSELAVVVNAK